MKLEEQIHQCRVIWTRARNDDDKELMKEMEKKAVFLKRLMDARVRWNERRGLKLKEEIVEPVTTEEFDQIKTLFTTILPPKADELGSVVTQNLV